MTSGAREQEGGANARVPESSLHFQPITMTSQPEVTSAPSVSRTFVVSNPQRETFDNVEHSALERQHDQSDTVTSASNHPKDRTDVHQQLVVAHGGIRSTSFDPADPVKSGDTALASASSSRAVATVATSKEQVYLDGLANELRLACIRSLEENDRLFIPNSDLENIVTAEAVSKILGNLGKVTETENDWLATGDPLTIGEGNPLPSRRKIFAILILSDKVGSILDFIEEGIYDHDLPFEISDTDTKVSCRRRRSPIKFFESWSFNERYVFNGRQWWMCSPSLQLNCIRHPKITRYVVEDRAVIPFINGETPSQQPPWNEGGFSVVKKARFHPSHYNWDDFCSMKEHNPFFAVKTIKNPIDESAPIPNREVETLIRLNGTEHDHLIKLLATFQHKKQLHLVFAWADGNLQEFWKSSTSTGDAPTHSVTLARWMALQCLGLASGLKAIHHNQIDKSKALEQGLELDASQKHKGRHGDLKPENILWFRSTEKGLYATPGVGDTLKISDFGFADFHASISASQISQQSLGLTLTYRAPEWDVLSNTTPAYDIWSIGCVFLEFVEWYLCGNKGVERFSQQRVQDSYNELPYYREDNFFNRKKMATDEKIAILKEAVPKEIHALRQLPSCSEYLLDFLDYIEDSLLRMKPKGRDGCDALVAKLEKLYEECSSDEDYCINRKRPARKQKTFLSEIVHISPKQRFSVSSNQAINEDEDVPEDRPHEGNSGLGIVTQDEVSWSHVEESHVTSPRNEPKNMPLAVRPIASEIGVSPSSSAHLLHASPLLETSLSGVSDTPVRLEEGSDQIGSKITKSSRHIMNGANRRGTREVEDVELDNKGEDRSGTVVTGPGVVQTPGKRKQLWGAFKIGARSISSCFRSMH